MTFKFWITSYGADYPVDGLVKRIESGDIYVPKFQRGFVWNYYQASRFIESLLLGLPVPGIFLSKEPASNKLLVLDGQQRLRTLQYFYNGVFDDERVFKLRGVQAQFEGATYKTLREEDRRRLDDSILHATIVKQDEPTNDESSIYLIFERLNTGAVKLTSQEIRGGIYHGEFIEELRGLNSNPAWREIYGPVNPQMKDQELILRFLALYYKGNEYKPPMQEFLNAYTVQNRDLRLQPGEEIRKVFNSTIELVLKALGNTAFRTKRGVKKGGKKGRLLTPIFDAVMVGLAQRLTLGPVRQPSGVAKVYESLLINEKFIASTETATTKEDNVRSRSGEATRAFKDIA
jgi:hypothetical protein